MSPNLSARRKGRQITGILGNVVIEIMARSIWIEFFFKHSCVFQRAISNLISAEGCLEIFGGPFFVIETKAFTVSLILSIHQWLKTQATTLNDQEKQVK